MFTINFARHHRTQAQVLSEARRFNVLCCARRWGKTTLGVEILAQQALRGFPTAWFGPTNKNISEAWRWAVKALDPVTVRKQEVDHRLELVTGGSLEMWSLDKPDPARGRKYKVIVIDEAAMIPHLQDAWQLTIRPTLTDMHGKAWFMSTPRGLNYFHTLYGLGQDPTRPQWASWQMPTLSNPHIDPLEIEEARKDMRDMYFSQEYLAQFVSFEGAVFRGIQESAVAVRRETPDVTHEYVFGVDWGRSLDYTVVAVLDATSRELVALERWADVDYAVQRNRLRAMAETWQPSAIIAESNSMGQPIIEQLYRDGLPVHPFLTTNASKALAVEAVALAFERGDLKIIADPVLMAELQAFQAERLPSGLTRYAAPQGQHDDTVMALCIAWSAIESYQSQPHTVIYEDRVQISPY